MLKRAPALLLVLLSQGCWTFEGIEAPRDTDGTSDTATDVRADAAPSDAAPTDAGADIDIPSDALVDFGPTVVAIRCYEGSLAPEAAIEPRVSIAFGVQHPWTAYVSANGPQLSWWEDNLASTYVEANSFPSTASSIDLAFVPAAANDGIIAALTDDSRASIWLTFDAETRSAGADPQVATQAVLVGNGRRPFYAAWYDPNGRNLKRISEAEGSQNAAFCAACGDVDSVRLRSSGGELLQVRHEDGGLWAWEVAGTGPGPFAVMVDMVALEYDSATIVYNGQYQAVAGLDEKYRALTMDGTTIAMREMELDGVLSATTAPELTQQMPSVGNHLVATASPAHGTWAVVATERGLHVVGWDRERLPLPPMKLDLSYDVAALAAASAPDGKNVFIAWVDVDNQVRATRCDTGVL